MDAGRILLEAKIFYIFLQFMAYMANGHALSSDGRESTRRVEG